MSLPSVRRLVARVPQVLRLSANIPSPCSSVCTMDTTTGWCQGCLRTIDEITQWAGMDDDRKRDVWARIGQRAQQSQT